MYKDDSIRVPVEPQLELLPLLFVHVIHVRPICRVFHCHQLKLQLVRLHQVFSVLLSACLKDQVRQQQEIPNMKYLQFKILNIIYNI